MPEILISPVVLLLLQAMFVFLICEDVMVIRAAIELKKPFEVLTRLIRLLFFSVFVLVLIVIGFADSVWLGIAQVVLAVIEIVAIFVLLPRIGRALQGAISEALIGGMITLFGVGASTISVMAKNYGGLLPGAAITATGGWMLYKAIQKMGQGE